MASRKYIMRLNIRRRLAAEEAYKNAIMQGASVKEAKAIARAVKAQPVTNFVVEGEAQDI